MIHNRSLLAIIEMFDIVAINLIKSDFLLSLLAFVRCFISTMCRRSAVKQWQMMTDSPKACAYMLCEADSSALSFHTSASLVFDLHLIRFSPKMEVERKLCNSGKCNAALRLKSQFDEFHIHSGTFYYIWNTWWLYYSTIMTTTWKTIQIPIQD